MADSDLSLTFSVDSGGAVAGVDRVTTALEETEAAAKGAGEAGKTAGAEVDAGFSKAAPEVAKVTAEVSELEAAEKELEAALKRLEGQTSMRGLQRGSAEAKVALENLEAAAKQAGGATDAMASRMKEAEAKMNGAATKAAQLRDALGDMKTRGDQAAKGFEAVAAQAGSVDGLLGQLKDTGGKTAQAMADLGFKATALAGSFMLGYEAGNKFVSALKEMTGVDITKAGQVLVDMAMGADQLDIAMLKIPSRFDAARAAASKFAQEMDNAKRWLAESGIQFKTVDEEIATLVADISILDKAIQQTVAQGQPATIMWKLHAGAMKDLDEKAKLLGISYQKVYANVASGVKFNAELAEASKNLAANQEAVRKSAEDEAAALQKMFKEIDVERLRMAKDQAKAFADELERIANTDLSRPLSGWTEQMTNFGDVMGTATKGFQGQVKILTLGMESLSEASEEATKKMKEMFESLRELEGSNAEMADRTAAVINNLRNAWANGMNDLTSWLQVWDNYYQSMTKIMLLNPGTAIAADMAKAIEAFKQLRQEVLMGKVPQTQHTNWGF